MENSLIFRERSQFLICQNCYAIVLCYYAYIFDKILLLLLRWDCELDFERFYVHTITPVFPEGLGRGVLMYTHSSPGC